MKTNDLDDIMGNPMDQIDELVEQAKDMNTKHTTEEILKEFQKKFLNHSNEFVNPWKFKGDTPSVGDLTSLASELENFLSEALTRKDEEWKEKVRGLRMKKDHKNELDYNMAVSIFNKKLDELIAK